MTNAAPYQQKSKTLSALSIAGVALTLGLAGCSNNDAVDTTANADDTAAAEGQNIELLNVSYDVARNFYKDYNPLFVEHYKSEHPNSTITVKQSHGGSSKQALSVAMVYKPTLPL